MAEQINQDLVTKVNSVISEHLQTISNLKTDHSVRQYKHDVEVNEIDGSVTTVSRVVEARSLKLITLWRAPENLVKHLANLNEDHGAFKSKIDFVSIKTYQDIEKVLNDSKQTAITFSHFIDSKQATDPLKLLLDNLNKMREILNHAQTLVTDEPDNSQELHAGLQLVRDFSLDWANQKRKWMEFGLRGQPLFQFVDHSHAIIVDSWLSSRIGVKIQKYDLKYRASIDGFAGTNFHGKCDGVNKLLVIIHSESGYLFGGFTSVPFGGNGHIPSTDGQSFVFTLTNFHNIPPTLYISLEKSSSNYSQQSYSRSKLRSNGYLHM